MHHTVTGPGYQLFHRPANPVGGAIGQLLSPLIVDTRQSVRSSAVYVNILLTCGIDSRTWYHLYGGGTGSIHRGKRAAHATKYERLIASWERALICPFQHIRAHDHPNLCGIFFVV